MKKVALAAACGFFTLLVGCKSDEKKNDSELSQENTASNSETADSQTLTIDFTPKSGTNASGTATFTEQNGEVTFTAKLTGLEPGVHAIHIHEKSDCSAPDASSAGGHWNPTFKDHGKWGSESYHRGDIGNFTANENGEGTITMTTSEWCIGCDDETKNILDKSVIVHLGADDFVTQPTGDAGGRAACSAIIR